MNITEIESFPQQPDKKRSPAELLNERINQGLAEAGAWASEARQALRYYRSDQYRFTRRKKDRHRSRMVANFIRRDVDQLVAAVLDSEPTVTPRGRHPRYYSIARGMVQLLDYTRDSDEDYLADLEKGVQDCFHIGEGVLYEGWDPYIMGGMGAPTTEWIDSRNVLWDPSAQKPQRDDARWVITLKHEDVDEIKDLFGLEHVQAEGIELFLSPSQVDRYRSRFGGGTQALVAGEESGSQKAWIKREWEKVRKSEPKYFSGGEEAFVEQKGDLVPVNAQIYRELTPPQQEGLTRIHLPNEELWETVVVNDKEVRRELSPFDKSKGGHGHYPFSFFSYVTLRDESHARGEIGFLIGTSDVRNETLSMLLDQAFLSNVGYFNVFKGSVPPEEREKLDKLGEVPFQVVEALQGSAPPQWIGANPGPSQVYQGLLGYIDQIGNRESGVHNVDRGSSEYSGQSGRAIRALQAMTARIGVQPRQHIESGLKRLTLLRLHNIGQFMQGTRAIEVVDSETQEDETLYVGRDMLELQATYGLQETIDPQTGNPVTIDKYGQPASVLVLSEDLDRDEIFSKIRLKLDTDRQANKLERHEQAREVIQIAGPAALGWYAEEMDLSNRDQLMDAIEGAQMDQQVIAELQEMAKQSGMEVPQIIQMMRQAFARMQGGPAGAGMVGPPPSPGGRQGNSPPPLPPPEERGLRR